ncbi:MAG: calcium-binding protein, partial [Candidatus Thiodiazotropha endolucinida]
IGAELLDLAGYNGVIPNHQVTNIVSDQGLDVTAGVGYVIGDTERIFIEQGSGIHNHSIANAVDSLAIYNLLASIDTSATLGRLSSILAAMVSHADRARTYESVVYALSDLFIAPIDVVTGNRDGLYQAIQAIETELFVDREVSVPQLETAYQNLTVEPLTDLTQDQIVTTAIGDIGYRYALTHLNPFAITGSESLYDDHNQNGELELNNSIIQEGELTQNYLTDRVAFLNTLNSFNRTNELVVGDHLIEFQDWDNGLIRRSAMITATDDAVSQRILFGDEQRDTFTGGTDHDRLYGGGGNDTLSGHAGDDGIEGNAGIDTLNGGLGDDALYGGADNDTLDGGNERDLLVGGRGEDHLIAGSENDILVGGYYLYDVASNISIYYDDDTPDRLEGGIGDDLYYADGGDTVNDEDGDGLIKMTVNLADGTEALVDLASSFWWTQNGVSNDYTVYIEPFDVSLRYVYDESSQILRVSQVNHPGNLVTIENFVNRDFGIRLGGGASVPDESYWRVTVYPDGSLSQPIEECYLSYDPWWYVAEHGDSAEPVLDENILGTEEADEIDAGNGDDVVHADDGNDQVHGNAGNDQLFGEGGNDTLYGDEGNDRLLGGDGLDRLFGGLGNDTLRGGLGNGDVLEGGLGNDTYFYAEGDGNTTISNFDNMIGRLDVLRFLDGVSAADVVATRTDYDLVLTLSGSAETITVTDYFVGDGVGYSLDLIEFAGGTQWDIDQIKTQVQQATVGDDYLYGYAEADTLEGLEGNDTLYGMSGDDILRGGAGNDRMYGNAGNDRLFGDTGVDEIYGGDGNDWIRGNGGDGDILNGGTGNDTYVFGDGDGDTIIQNHDAGEGRHDVLRFRDGITSDDIEVSRSEYDLLLTRVSSGEAITVSGYFYEDGGWTRALDEIRFEDGTSWDTGTILARVLLGSDEDDTIFGYSGDDTIEGMAGNDTLVGEAGDDTLSGGVGFDLLYGGDGDDRIEGGPDHDRLAGESGNDYLVGGSGHDTLNGGDGDDILICGNDT